VSSRASSRSSSEASSRASSEASSKASSKTHAQRQNNAQHQAHMSCTAAKTRTNKRAHLLASHTQRRHSQACSRKLRQTHYTCLRTSRRARISKYQQAVATCSPKRPSHIKMRKTTRLRHRSRRASTRACLRPYPRTPSPLQLRGRLHAPPFCLPPLHPPTFQQQPHQQRRARLPPDWLRTGPAQARCPRALTRTSPWTGPRTAPRTGQRTFFPSRAYLRGCGGPPGGVYTDAHDPPPVTPRQLLRGGAVCCGP
jgi:hypothetical protein